MLGHRRAGPTAGQGHQASWPYSRAGPVGKTSCRGLTLNTAARLAGDLNSSFLNVAVAYVHYDLHKKLYKVIVLSSQSSKVILFKVMIGELRVVLNYSLKSKI